MNKIEETTDRDYARRIPIVGWWTRLSHESNGVENIVIGLAEAVDVDVTVGYAKVQLGSAWYSLGPGYGGMYVLEAIATDRSDLAG